MDDVGQVQRRRWILFSAIVILIAILGVAVTLSVVPRLAPVHWSWPWLDGIHMAHLPANGSGATSAPLPHFTNTRGSSTPWVLFVGSGIAVIVLGWVMFRPVRRWLTRLRARRARTVHAPDMTLSVEVAPAAPERALPRPDTVHRGLQRALDILDERREPRDAIEAAWLSIEEAAASSGVRRGVSETPHEFTRRIVGSLPSGGDALRTLLALYLTARFSEHPLSRADHESARRAVATLHEVWGSRVGEEKHP